MTTFNRRSAEPQHALTPHLLFALAVVFLSLTLITLRNDKAALVAAVLCLTSVGAAAALTASAGSFRRSLAHGRFGTWASLWIAVSFGLTSLSWRSPQTGTAAQVSVHSVVLALLLVSFAWTIWLVGYMLPIGRRLGTVLAPLLAGPVPREATYGRVLLLFLIGLLGQMLKLVTNGFGYLADPTAQIAAPSIFGQAIEILSSFGYMSVAAASYLAFCANNRRRQTFAVALCLIQCAFGLLSGTKQPIVIAVLALVFGYAAARRRLPLRLMIPGLAIFILVVIPFNAAYRGTVRSDQGTLNISQSVAAAPAILSTTFTGSASQANTLNASTALSLRLREIDSVAITVQRTPKEISYVSPASLLVAPVLGIIPRAIWPSKPVLDAGYKFTQEYFGLPPDVHSSTAVTPFADLFRRGGLPVLLIGMIALGILYQVVDTTIASFRDIRYLFFVLAGFALFVKLETDAVAMLASLVPFLLAPAVAGRLLKPRLDTMRPRQSVKAAKPWQ